MAAEKAREEREREEGRKKMSPEEFARKLEVTRDWLDRKREKMRPRELRDVPRWSLEMGDEEMREERMRGGYGGTKDYEHHRRHPESSKGSAPGRTMAMPTPWPGRRRVQVIGNI